MSAYTIDKATCAHNDVLHDCVNDDGPLGFDESPQERGTRGENQRPIGRGQFGNGTRQKDICQRVAARGVQRKTCRVVERVQGLFYVGV